MVVEARVARFRCKNSRRRRISRLELANSRFLRVKNIARCAYFSPAGSSQLFAAEFPTSRHSIVRNRYIYTYIHLSVSFARESHPSKPVAGDNIVLNSTTCPQLAAILSRRNARARKRDALDVHTLFRLRPLSLRDVSRYERGGGEGRKWDEGWKWPSPRIGTR